MKRVVLSSALLVCCSLFSQEKADWLKESTFSSLTFRSIGPALVSGRIADIAVNPKNTNEYYLAVAAGGVWKTINNGTTFEPIFDGEGSYSIGCVSIDPSNTNTVWVGSGENNNQRSVGYGDGVYKSEDNGQTWKNMGLKSSEHIGKIAIDPNNSEIVYVAAYGPLWSAGGERGIYKTTDGGKNWKQVLYVSENTGFNDVIIDPSHPNILYAAAHQRRRHEWTYISGGPESAIYKSIDGGATWNKLTNGLPSSDMGRIGLALSPSNTDILYAIIEGNSDSKGVYKSSNRGASWTKQSSWSTAGNYYQEIVVDPINAEKLYSLDTWAQVSYDGGKSFTGMGEKNKHVDNHALYIDPVSTSHMLMGCDGGLYETYDGAATWQFKANLPITQFYRVSVDNSLPFYYVYGGTQDNNSLGGPSRTTSASGIANKDWFITVGGDGFETQIDPENPDIVYSQWQYGGLIRYDRKTGEALDIKPQEKEGEPAYRWNWDAPLLISSFNSKRLYFAANKVFRSDDMGNSWKVISPDLSRQVDRNKLPVMGMVWGMDAIAKNQSTSIFGNITAFAESPKNEKLLYAGTDDGLIQVSENGGDSWLKIEKFPGITPLTVNGITVQPLVHSLFASQHQEATAYAVFNNHRYGDFKPYVLKTSDKGKTWTNITANLPARGSAYVVTEDHVNPNLLFVGTEFGLYFTLDGGISWIKMNNGLPTICIRDIAIQKRENDLVLATFGRGFYVLDDYSILQKVKKEDFEKTAMLFPVKDAPFFIPSTPLGHKGKSFQGASYYVAENPPIGATITYFLKNDYKTEKEKRKEVENDNVKKKLNSVYPSKESIKAESLEEAPYLLASITDEQANVIRKYKLPAKKGLKRFVWDGRYAKTSPVTFYKPDPDNPYEGEDMGQPALPGKYGVTLFLVQDTKTEKLTETVYFNLTSLTKSSTPISNSEAQKKFFNDLASFRNVVLGTESYKSEMQNRLKFIKEGLTQSSGNTNELMTEISQLEKTLKVIDEKLNGEKSLAKYEFETLNGITGIIENMVGGIWSSTSDVPGTYSEALSKAKKLFLPVYQEIKAIRTKIEAIEMKLDNMKFPYTPGRLPDFKGE